ncbi:hypothetical protein HNY73_006015 [Argiope bruennichi]|uniref:Uncharacterized protein n=1 Tax=Argiope bruennichi TaxID=94029 RepID=A0A8T0FLI9_ARGBR|nr:hypothetical protein HNY73_006015 [Argiope bruennichi]
MADNKARKLCYVFSIRSRMLIARRSQRFETKFKVRCNKREKFEAVRERMVQKSASNRDQKWKITSLHGKEDGGDQTK